MLLRFLAIASATLLSIEKKYTDLLFPLHSCGGNELGNPRKPPSRCSVREPTSNVHGRLEAEQGARNCMWWLLSLVAEEMRRRREFLSQHPEVRTAGMDLEQRGLAHLVPAYSLPEERISLVLELATP